MAASLAAGLGHSVQAGARENPRPAYEFLTDEAFDAAAVPAYAGRHEAVYAQIDRDLDAHVAALQRWVRQRSISAQDDGISRHGTSSWPMTWTHWASSEVEIVPDRPATPACSATTTPVPSARWWCT
jgi:hypothetical protein